MTVELDGHSLTIEEVAQVAEKGEKVEISEEALETVEDSRIQLEERYREGERIYGFNTGFGALVDEDIGDEDIITLQKNMIWSHSVGVGDPLNEENARAVMLVKLNTLLTGHSGVCRETVEKLKKYLNSNIHPQIPSKGSLGASGSIAPLSHMVLALIGEGKMKEDGEWQNAEDVLENKGIEPLKLKAKEGLALVNGTSFITGIGCLALLRANKLVNTADIAGSLSAEAMKAVKDAYREDIQELRPYKGQKVTASNIRKLTKNSQLVKDDSKGELQDAHSLRCIPQVHGACREAIEYVKEILETEINSITDNPVIMEDKVVSCGNFHGQPVSQALDYLGSVITSLGNISERRIAKMVDRNNSKGLPPFLIRRSGLNSGLMATQYTAASLASKNKVLSHPSSSDSIPSSANQEDHVSMGANAASHLLDIEDNTAAIIAIELLCGYQGVNFRKEEPGEGTEKVCREISKHVKPLEHDRIVKKDFIKLKNLLEEGKFQEILGELGN
ncbi:MAG: histidine ammonia-lyase [Candidatus Nanohaloarchaea archaeon]|nr:histidine ammonia-lyase [Candidatus Nanohaloarchaea archaeon]